MLPFSCIVLPAAGELFQRGRSAVDIVLDFFACFILFDSIITFVSAEISGVAAYPVFFSVQQIRNSRDIRCVCWCHLDMMHQSAFFVNTDMPLVSEMPLFALFSSNVLPDLASSLDSL